MDHLFFGHDDRTNAGTTAFVSSVLMHASKPLAITAITRKAWRDYPEGTNAFTLRRFLVPYMCGYQGWALFVDGSDMLCRDDIAKLFDHKDERKAVLVVKHDYRTRSPRKYRGTTMEADNLDYPRKQWASVMLMNCGHPAWKRITPECVRDIEPMRLLQLSFIPDAEIGELPIEWNWLVDEDRENEQARLLHFTLGIPAFIAHTGAPMAEEWHAALDWANSCAR